MNWYDFCALVGCGVLIALAFAAMNWVMQNVILRIPFVERWLEDEDL